MSTLTNADFMSPYDVGKYLDGVIPGNKDIRQNWLQSHFGNRDTTELTSINLDREFDQGNIMGQYVHPKAKAGQIELPDFGTSELRFAYWKEALQSDDFITLNQRQMGDQFGQVDVLANDARRLDQKLGLALGTKENLMELAARDILIYGKHTATSTKHAPVVWDFNRTVITSDADYLKGYIPEVDLTTLNGNGGVGKRAWGATGGTTGPTPYKDLVKMVQTANRRQGVEVVWMSEDAADALEVDINSNYKDAATLTLAVEQRISMHVLPIYKKYQTLNYRRTVMIGQQSIDIFTYGAVYKDRVDGTKKSFEVPGRVVCIPPSNNQIVRYGRIMHRKANWTAMPIWVNVTTDSETGEIEQTLQSNFVLAPLDIDSVVSWKVM